MNISQVSVTVKKSLSDGHYGSEAAEVQFVADLDAGDDPDLQCEALLIRARQQVTNELSYSESATVRRAISPPPPVTEEATSDIPF